MKRHWFVIAAIVVLIAVLLFVFIIKQRNSDLSFLGQKDKPRGLRNNNPGNIKISSADWAGKVHPNTDGTFEQFKSFKWGVRAMIKLLRDNYMGKYKLRTIDDIIWRWASNNGNYPDYVAKDTGFSRTQSLETDKTTIKKLLLAMAQMESGKEAREATAKVFDAAWDLSTKNA